MNTNIAKIKTRIAAMMAKTKDVAATEQEAAAAMKMALALMEKYGVTESDILDRPDEIDFVTRHAYHEGVALHEVDSLLAVPIAEFVGVKVWASSGFRSDNVRCVIFFGIDSDVELALFLRHSLQEAMNYGWTMYKRFELDRETETIRSAKRSFMAGFANKLRERLEAYTKTAATGKDLVVLKNQLVEAAFAKQNVTLIKNARAKRVLSKDASAYHSGGVAGNAADIGRGVGGKVAGLLT